MIKEFYSENRYKGVQNSELNMQSIDDTIGEIFYRNFKTGSRDNFKDNLRPAVVTNNFPEHQHVFHRKKIFPEKSRALM